MREACVCGGVNQKEKGTNATWHLWLEKGKKGGGGGGEGGQAK